MEEFNGSVEGLGDHLSKRKRCKKYCKTFVAFLFSTLGLFIMVVAYAILGGLLFKALEEVNEKLGIELSRQEVEDNRNTLMDTMYHLQYDSTFLEKKNWTEAVKKLMVIHEELLFKASYGDWPVQGKWDGKPKGATIKQTWDFSSSLLYAITVITTIGYGHVTPVTFQGMISTIFYALVGIPLTLMCIANVGKVFSKFLRLLYHTFCCGVCCIGCYVCKVKHRFKRRTLKIKGNLNRAQGEICFVKIEEAMSLSLPEPCYPEKTDDEDVTIWKRQSSVMKDCTMSTLVSAAETEKSAISADVEKPLLTPTDNLTPSKWPTIEISKSAGLALPPDNVSQKTTSDYFLSPNSYCTPNNSETKEVLKLDGGTSIGTTSDMEWSDNIAYNFGFHWKNRLQKGLNDQSTVPLYVCTLLMAGYIFGGALLFSVWEGWNYVEASYFCFVTLTTIGFGDFVPGATISRNHAASTESTSKLIFCCLYLFVGLALVAMCFDLMQAEVISKIKWFGKKIGVIKTSQTPKSPLSKQPSYVSGSPIPPKITTKEFAV